MTVPTANEILALRSEHVAEFIKQHSNTKTLSAVMRRLNHDLMGPDETASAMAEKALRHLGFRVDP
ncbi:MAG: hypothetical protein NXH79_07000 [Rhodobacteraceae bacterium]|jgi:hypothetical protein|nr:hypothetical protein [Paracoccaceae bacterium]